MIIGSKIVFMDSLESTNNYASGLLKKEVVPEGTVIHTHYQTAGRGQIGNKWESEAGKNLLISIIIYPHHIQPEEQFDISVAISLGVLDYIKPLVRSVSIKWPNDIYADDRKIAGLLIENALINNSIVHTVVGIGLNVNQMTFPRYVPNPISLKMITGKEYDLRDCLTQLLPRIDRRYRQLVSDKSLKLKNEYISSLYGFMEWRSFRTISRGAIYGRITGISRSGQLVVEEEDKSINYFSFKEIEFTV